MEKKVIHAALLGFGTVGTGVYKVLKNQEEEMEAKLGKCCPDQKDHGSESGKGGGKGGRSFCAYKQLGRNCQ